MNEVLLLPMSGAITGCCRCPAGGGRAEEVWFRDELLFPELRPVRTVQELGTELGELRCRGALRSLRFTPAGGLTIYIAIT